MNTARIFCGLTAMICGLASVPAYAQRVQFATPLAQAPTTTPGTPAVATPPATTFAQPAAPSTYPPPSLTAPSTAPAATTFGPSASPSPGSTYTPSPAITTAPAGVPGAVVQTPPANWDPYATPCNTPSPLLSQDPYIQSVAPPVTMATVQKFIQHVDLDYHWFAGHGPQELGINDVELSATFAFPLFHNAATPLLVTPGFATHWWEGPVSIEPPAPPADMPERTYDAYLDAAWNPQFNDFFGGELEGRVGVYSDFINTTSQAIRVTGKGLAVLKLTPSIKLKLGVWYLDRVIVKLLPAGGICWTPNPDIYFNVLFPNPKMGKRLTTWGNTEWWIYASGDYGGGTWQITRNNGVNPNPYLPDMNGAIDVVDYNDIRVAIGLEFNTSRQFHGMFEVGGSFNRELAYQSKEPSKFVPNNTVYLRTGIAY